MALKKEDRNKLNWTRVRGILLDLSIIGTTGFIGHATQRLYDKRILFETGEKTKKILSLGIFDTASYLIGFGVAIANRLNHRKELKLEIKNEREEKNKLIWTKVKGLLLDIYIFETMGLIGRGIQKTYDKKVLHKKGKEPEKILGLGRFEAIAYAIGFGVTIASRFNHRKELILEMKNEHDDIKHTELRKKASVRKIEHLPMKEWVEQINQKAKVENETSL